MQIVALDTDHISPVVCCIYHAPHPIGESSSESSSDSDSGSNSSDSDSGGSNDDGRAQMGGIGAKKDKRRHPHQHHEGEDGCSLDNEGGRSLKKKGKAMRKQRKPNAYETVPHNKPKKAEIKS